jgi:Putative auto-transporter adhesin, head GIN domain
VLSLVLLSSAWVLGGDALSERIHQRKGFSVNIDTDNGGPRTERTLTFDPAVPLTITAPVNLRFTRGDTVSMTVSGEKKTVDALVWEGGTLSAGGGIKFGDNDIKVTITAPRLSALTLNSAAEAKLSGLDQPSLKVETRGAVEMDASGMVEDLDISTAGASDLDFRELAATDAKVVTRGAGDVTIAASGKVEVEINGVGSVSLRRKPGQLTSRINGLGSVDNDY